MIFNISYVFHVFKYPALDPSPGETFHENSLAPFASVEASYILYELAGDAMTTMTLTHDWEWPPG
jgi:hypothetical protein